MASTAADIIASAKAEAEAARQSAIASLSGLGTDLTNAYNTQQAATTAQYQNQLNQLQTAYQSNAKQAYGNYMENKQNLANQLNRLGLANTGYGVSQGLLAQSGYSKNLAGLQSAYQTNQANVGVAEQQALADLYNTYAKNKLGLDQYIYEAGRSAYDTAYKNSYQAQQDAIANALQQQYYNYLMSSRSYGGGGGGGYSGGDYELTDGSSNSSVLDAVENRGSNYVTNVNRSSPALSSKSANNWYDQNIDKVYFSSGLTADQLASALERGLDSKAITQADKNKILKTFGYDPYALK